MAENLERQLRVFLCHASQDKPAVRALYKRLREEAWIDPWLDSEKLLPGMEWDLEIEKAVEAADAVVVILSTNSVTKEGYVQRELRFALQIAEYKPEGTIFIIPIRLDDCVTPRRLTMWQYLNYYEEGAPEKLLMSLQMRFDSLGLKAGSTEKARPKDEIQKPAGKKAKVAPKTEAKKPAVEKTRAKPKTEAMKTVIQETKSITVEIPDLYQFIQIPETTKVPYPFWIGKYPVTNGQYARFLDAPDYASEEFWTGFLRFDEKYQQNGKWRDEGWQWLQKNGGERIEPRYWKDKQFGISQPGNPVVGVTWYEANAYCQWLFRHWLELDEVHANSGLRPRLVRLPLETEWVIAAGGEKPEGRYPWDLPGMATTDEKEVLKRANVAQKVGHTTPVNTYPDGKSPHGVMDMAGNVWEWQANFYKGNSGWLSLRGGSWDHARGNARAAIRLNALPDLRYDLIGFRVVAFPS